MDRTTFIKGFIPQRRIARSRARAAEKEMLQRVNATISRIARTPPATLETTNRGAVKLLDNQHDLKTRIENQQVQIVDLIRQVEEQRKIIAALKDFTKLIDANEFPFSIKKIQDILTGKIPSIEDFEVVCDATMNEDLIDQSEMNIDITNIKKNDDIPL